MGTFQQAIEAVANDAGVCEATWTVPIGRPLRLERMSALGTSIVQPPSSEENTQRYRGVWDGDGPLVYTQDFAASSTLPPGFLIENGGSATGVVSERRDMATQVPAAANAPIVPPYKYAWYLRDQGTSPFGVATAIMKITKADVPELAEVNITKVSAWLMAQLDNTNTSYHTSYAAYSDGTIGTQGRRVTGGVTSEWDQITFRTGANAASLTFRALDELQNQTTGLWQTANWPSRLYMAGLKVWGKTPDSAYRLNDTVAYKGYVWLCTQANTSSEPGKDGTWEQVEGTMSSTGNPHLLVYRNGVLIDSTGNANTDVSQIGIDLNPGDNIRATWSRCSGGALMRLVLDGDG